VQAKTAAPAAAARHPALPPGHPPSAQPALQTAGVIQAARKRGRGNDDDSDGEYIPPHLRKKKKIPRYRYKDGSRERVVKVSAHKKKHYNKKKYRSVYTCRNCGRPVAYYDKSGKFHEGKYAYTSKKNKNLHDGTALAMDHYPRWADRYHQHVKNKSNSDEMRDDFQDESKLRALCKACNESHLLETGDLPDDYDSDNDGRFDPGTPTHEPENKGRWSDFWDKGPGPGSAGGAVST
jgi:hypothetical protein